MIQESKDHFRECRNTSDNDRRLLKMQTSYGYDSSNPVKHSKYSKSLPTHNSKAQTLQPNSPNFILRYCMTRSSTNELYTPYKDSEREFLSSRRHFKSLSLDELRSPNFNLLSNEEYSEEEEEEAMTETMEQYMS
ncbi:hypothetical protein Tco_1013749 [Tanacetum coccineum]